VVHCAAGRDRTGIVIGALLSLIGVEPDDIADDYALSAGRCDDNVPCERRTMQLFLAAVRREYGGVRALANLTDDEATALTRRLTARTTCNCP
jgi:protein-tyrosine phosphatase